MEDVNAEWRRLQALYADLGDTQLLDLLRERAELTEVAQRALDAEVGSRGLVLPVDEKLEAPRDIGEDETDEVEEGFYRLWRFQLASDAETAVAALDDAGIASMVRGARARVDGVGPLVDVPGLDLFVEAKDGMGAKSVLQKKMKLFPEGESDYPGDDVGENEVFVAGSFVTEVEADSFVFALKRSGIGAEKCVEEDGEGSFWNVEVAFDDLPQATEVAERMQAGENA